MTTSEYLDLKKRVVEAGYEEEINFYRDALPCANADAFFQEYCWVVLNSGMKNQVARRIYDKVMPALRQGKSAGSVFNHKGKAAAIDKVYRNRHSIFGEFEILQAVNLIPFLLDLPWIGSITVYHLAKNLGMDCVKPDRHLVRIANKYEMKPHAMCEAISKETGDRLSVVDYVIWRAANLGWI